MKILPMTDKLFAHRRRVIAMLYEARDLLKMELPRIKVRIVDFENDRTLGLCFIDKDYITISQDLVNWNDTFLREIVWHELAHAYFNAKHDEKCILMRPTRSLDSQVSKARLARAFKKVARLKTQVDA